MNGAGIRAATPADAAALLELKLALDSETTFMLLEPGERRPAPADVAAELERIGGSENSVILVADAGGALVGYVEALGGEHRRDRHRAEVVLGVRTYASGRGIGGALLRALDAWAQEAGVRRLELSVMAHNERAISLYRRCGYAVEGTRRGAVVVAGALVDELWMAKLS